MHTCDGCYYCNEDGSCKREYYPELERKKRKAVNNKNDKWTIAFCWTAIVIIITTIYIACVF